MYLSKIKDDRSLLFLILISIAIFYLILIWKTTANLDRLTTDALFWGAILWLLWQKKERLKYNSDPISSFLGLFLLGIVLDKSINLFSFESPLLSLLPIAGAIALALIASGIKGIHQYYRELFFIWFLFFPIGVLGQFIDRVIPVTILNAKVATYLLYYLGFKTISYGNQVIIDLGAMGNFKAVVDYPCAGLPMILLILKLSLILISCVYFKKKQQIIIPFFSIVLGFLLGVVRVCILTLLIPHRLAFEYWHGDMGAQIFSTLAIAIFTGFCYCMMQKNQQCDRLINDKC